MRGVYPLMMSCETAEYHHVVPHVDTDRTERPTGISRRRSSRDNPRQRPYATGIGTGCHITRPTMTACGVLRFRLKFLELFMIQVNMLRINRARRSQLAGFKFTRIAIISTHSTHNACPFYPAWAKGCCVKYAPTLNTGGQMSQLLQGGRRLWQRRFGCADVHAHSHRQFRQACLMAPTEILAAQHYETISQMARENRAECKTAPWLCP